jgi:V/A-type H+-transporting ATPase subunit E
MSIERITKKILEDAENRAQEIKVQYEKKLAEVKRLTNEESEKIRTENEKRIKNEYQSIRERAATVANLEQKKKTLAAKWEVIDNIFDSAAKKFLSLPEYPDIIVKLIEANTEEGNSEIILSQTDLSKIKPRIEDAKFAESIPIKGGVIIRSGNVEKNFSLDATLTLLKDELIIELAKILFEK